MAKEKGADIAATSFSRLLTQPTARLVNRLKRVALDDFQFLVIHVLEKEHLGIQVEGIQPNAEGPLCGALFKYFDGAPKSFMPRWNLSETDVFGLPVVLKTL
jgi:hypothetical protein